MAIGAGPHQSGASRLRHVRYPPAPEEATDGRCLVWLDIPEPEQKLALLTVGAYFDRDSVRGDKLHNQLLRLPDVPTPLTFQAVGEPEALATRTADWFEALLRRPVVRHEWLRDDVVYAFVWCFDDTGQGLVQGKVSPRGLGPPDRTVRVRGHFP